MKNIRLVFDRIIDGEIIPNTMPIHLVEKLTEHIKSGGNFDTFRESLFLEYRYPTYPYSSTWESIWTTNEADLLSELESSDNYITSENVYYLYYIGTAGNIEFGLNPQQVAPDSNIIKTSYFENLSNTVINYTKTKNNFFIYFDNNQEGIDFRIVNEIYKQGSKLNIPLNKIVLKSDSADFSEIKNKLETEYKTKIDLKYLMHPWALALGAEYINELTNRNNIVTDFKTNRNNKVVCLNRRLKNYRTATVSFLLGMNYQNMYLSYDTDWGDLSQYHTRDFLNNSLDKKTLPNRKIPIENILDTGFEILKTTKKRKADNIDDDFNLVYWDSSKMYEDSYFSIVTESEWYGKLRLTEKITKPIINYHPFIIVGPHKTLEILKFYGFKTFSEFWDESYDEIENTKDRFEEVIKIIDKLMNLSTDEWDNLTKKLKPILIYNRERLLSFQYHKIHDKFLENMVSLLENKFSNHYYSII